MLNVFLVIVLFCSCTTYAETIYVHSDILGSPVVETNSSGTVVSRSHYKPFGDVLEGMKKGVGYTGHLNDKDLGLTYMQARYYDPVIGRFYSNDPVGWTERSPVHSFGRYTYANNNPYLYTDPNGEFPETWADAGKVFSGTVDVLKGSVTFTGGVVLSGVGVIGIAAPEPGTTIVGAGLLALGTSAIPVGTNQTVEGFSQISEGWTGEKMDTASSRTPTVGDAINSVAGNDTSKVNIGNAVDNVISQTANNALPASAPLTAIQNASTMKDTYKAVEKLREDK